jgi:chromate reductase, NAD(P)H dehydrogenase (quinone)
MSDLTLLGLCGSLRAASLNRKLMLESAGLFGGTFIEGDLRLPLYDGDIEDAGVPEGVMRLVDQIEAADAILIACPEYNKAPPATLKNALDWVSRVKPNRLWGTPVAIVSATAGRAGGERSQTLLRSMLVPHRVEALSWPEVLVGDAENQFEGEHLANDRYRKVLGELMERLRLAAG